jgi:hypothetical protein
LDIGGGGGGGGGFIYSQTRVTTKYEIYNLPVILKILLLNS